MVMKSYGPLLGPRDNPGPSQRQDLVNVGLCSYRLTQLVEMEIRQSKVDSLPPNISALQQLTVRLRSRELPVVRLHEYPRV